MPNYFEIEQKFRPHGPMKVYALVCSTKRLINGDKLRLNHVLENSLNKFAFLLNED